MNSIFFVGALNQLFQIKVMNVLIQYGANAEAKDYQGFTPLYYAAFYNQNLDVVEYLINNGSGVNKVEMPSEKTLLHLAAINGHCKAAEVLIIYGANVSSKKFCFIRFSKKFIWRE